MATRRLVMVVVVLVAATGLVRAEVNQDFRGKQFNQNVFRLEGSKPGEYVHPEDEGLRISVPEAGPKTPVGIVLRTPPRGDFVAAIDYELLSANSPKAGSGVGISVYLGLDSADHDGVILARVQPEKGGQIFSLRHLANDRSGKRVQKSFNKIGVLSGGQAGTLRLARSGGILTASIAEEPSAEFRVLGTLSVGTDDVRVLRVAADPGNVSASVDVRITDFRLQTQEDLGTSVAGASRFWVIWVLGGGLSGFAVALLVIWARAPKQTPVRHGRAAAAETDQSDDADSESRPSRTIRRDSKRIEA